MELTVQGGLIIKSENIEHSLTMTALLTYTFPTVFVRMFLQPILALGLQTLQMLGSYLQAELRTSTLGGRNCNAAGYACPYFFSVVFLPEDKLISLEPLLFKQNSKSCRGLGRRVWFRGVVGKALGLRVSSESRVPPGFLCLTPLPHHLLGWASSFIPSLILSPRIVFLPIYFWHNRQSTQYGVGKGHH